MKKEGSKQKLFFKDYEAAVSKLTIIRTETGITIQIIKIGAPKMITVILLQI